MATDAKAADAAFATVVDFFCGEQRAAYDASTVQIVIDDRPVGTLTNVAPGTYDLRIRPAISRPWRVREIRYLDIAGGRGRETYRPNTSSVILPLVFTARPSTSSVSSLNIEIETCGTVSPPVVAAPPPPAPVTPGAAPAAAAAPAGPRCSAALVDEYARLLAARTLVQEQLRTYGSQLDLDIATRRAISDGVTLLSRAATAAAADLEQKLGSALDNVFLQPLQSKIEAAVAADVTQVVKGKYYRGDEAGAVMDLVGAAALKDEVRAKQQERGRLQSQWIQQIRTASDAAQAILRTLPSSSREMVARLQRQLDDINGRVTRYQDIASESRCSIPAVLPTPNPDWVILGLHPPLDLRTDASGRTPAVTDHDVQVLNALVGGGFGLEPLLYSGRGDLLDGTAIMAAPPDTGATARSHTVRTPEATIAPSGTIYLVHRDRQRAWTFVYVGDGQVTVMPVRGGPPVRLLAGQSALASSAGAIALRPGGSSVPGGMAASGAIGPEPGAPPYMQFVGCYKDTSAFDLDGYLMRSAANTPQSCVATCRGRGFRFAGVQYGESCLCGNSYGRYGPANNCNMRCTGDGNQICGGYAANSVFTTGVVATAPAAPAMPGPTAGVVGTWSWAFARTGEPVDQGTITFNADGTMRWSGGSQGTWQQSGNLIRLTWSGNAQQDTMTLSADGLLMEGRNSDGWRVRGRRSVAAGAQLVGCYKDTIAYDLDGYLVRSAANTPQSCVATCRSRGFRFAGVQYGESCLCGNSYGRYGPANNCNMRCTGDNTQICGGYAANSVYATGR